MYAMYTYRKCNIEMFKYERVYCTPQLLGKLRTAADTITISHQWGKRMEIKEADSSQLSVH